MIVDDDDLMRAGLAAVLAHDPGIVVVEETGDGRRAVERAAFVEIDVVLMDVRMPRLDGIAATRELLEVAPGARVIVLTTFEEDAYILGALKAGASGFLLKRTPPEDLIAAIHTVMLGDALLSPSVTRRLIDRLAGQPLLGSPGDVRLDVLTARERQVLGALATGSTNREIARSLFIEESTVKSHVKAVMTKLDLRNRVQAVIMAYETGLLSPGDGRRSKR